MLVASGLVGRTRGTSVVTSSYWDISSTGMLTSTSGTGLSSDDDGQMGVKENFVDWLFSPDENYSWVMPAGGPPKLWWEE
jgi:hypothetical protein